MAGQLGLARARAQARLLWAIAATALILVFALAAALGWLTGAMRAAVAAAVDDVRDSAQSTVLEIPAADDPDAQSQAVEALLHGRFGASLRIEPDAAAPGGTSRWTLTVDPERFDPWVTAAIAADLHDLAVLARDTPDLAPDGADTEGDLAATLADAADAVRAAQAVVPVPLALVATAGLVATLQLARLLGAARRREAAVLTARGRSRGAALRSAVGESTAVVLLGAVAGWLAAAGAVAATGGDFGDALIHAVAVPVLVTLIAGFAIAVAARRAEDSAAAPTARTRGAVLGIGAVLLLLAAAVLLWLLASLGRDAAAITADPWSLAVVALAPALGLAAVATLALLLFAPTAAGFARVAARSPRLGAVLAARTTARRIAASGVVVAIVALAAGGAVLAGAALGTWRTAAEATGVLVAGADARGTLDDQSVSAAAVAQTDAATGVDAAGAVLADQAAAGGAELAAVLVPEQSAATLIAPLPAAGIDPADLAAALGSAPVGEALADGTTAVQATWAVTPSAGAGTPVPESGAYAGTAWFVDALGTPEGVTMQVVFTPLTWADPVHPDPTVPDWVLAPEPTSGTLTAIATLPSGRAPWTLVGLDVGFAGSAGGLAPELAPQELTTASAGAAAAPLAWPSTAPVVLSADAPSTTVVFAPAPAAAPVVVTAGLATALGLGEGDRFDLTLDGSSRTIPVQIAGIVPAVPGSTAAAAALLPLDQTTLVLVATTGDGVAANEVWASGPDAAAAIAAAEPEAAVVSGDDDGRLTAALTVPWWIAAGVAAALAGVALVAGALGLAQSRAGDVFVLGALGVPAPRQARWRAGEHIAVAIAALIAGTVLGIPLALIAVPALTRAAVPDVPVVLAGALQFDALPLVIVAAVIALAVLAATLAAAALIRRQARAGRLAEAP